MKVKTILALAALTLLATACGSDEPDVVQATMMNENNGKTVLPGTDVYLDSEGRLVSAGGDYSISLCRFTDIGAANVLEVNMSLNKRMKVAAGSVYAITDISREHSFPTGKVALEAGAPITYVKVTDMITDGATTTGVHYQSVATTAERGSLPKWDNVYTCQKMDEDTWNVTIPLSYQAYEIANYDDLYTVKTTNAQGNNINLQIDHKYVKADHSDDYEDRLLVTYVLNNYIYIRYGSYGGVCVRVIVKE